MTGFSKLPKEELKSVSGKPERGISIFWMRRDLRLKDNAALYHALISGSPVLVLFIFDEDIINDLEKNDSRITFIYENLKKIYGTLSGYGSTLLAVKGKCLPVWEEIVSCTRIDSVFWNEDYEPYAISRDKTVGDFLSGNSITIKQFKDQVVFGPDEVLKSDMLPYTVFTPYSKKWLSNLYNTGIPAMYKSEASLSALLPFSVPFPTLESLGFVLSEIKVRDFNPDNITDYDNKRDYPELDATSYASPHLRFGTLSIREVVRIAKEKNNKYLSELIWREFFMQILYHYPHVVTKSFKPEYDLIRWNDNEEFFEKWCTGKTGYPIVDAGMRQLNKTGYMHNRVRMITASFLCKHLLTDWRKGEKYFAGKLLDYELSSNNGNWQWSASTGCDAAPYFRVFNPYRQTDKFDPGMKYTRKWVPEYNSPDYPEPVVDHDTARKTAIETYRYYLKREKQG